MDLRYTCVLLVLRNRSRAVGGSVEVVLDKHGAGAGDVVGDVGRQDVLLLVNVAEVVVLSNELAKTTRSLLYINQDIKSSLF